MEGRFREFQQGNECQIDRLTALEPTNRIQAERGLTEVWDSNEQEFRCAGVSVIRRTIEPHGLLLPSFTSAPELIYIEQGNGITGMMIPGCPETYESGSQQFQGGEDERIREQGSRKFGMRGDRFQDQHQKIRHLREGDIFAMPAGVSHWAYNNGDQPLVAVILIDTANHANQLDKNFPTRFYLAGKPQQEHSGEHQFSRESRRGERNTGNIFRGFETRLLAESFGVSEEIAQKLQAEQDDRGNIVRVQEGLHVIKPPSRAWEEREQGSRGSRYLPNGVEETICSARLAVNVDDPSKADVYTPEAGRLTTVNSFNLPILRHLRLSAAKGVLYRNAMMAPHYNLNAHNIMYCVRGRGRIQIVNDQGQSVFDEELSRGQLVVVPQNFAIVKQAFEDGFEWVSFKTSENAMFQSLAGRTSAIRSLPIDVVSNIYQISREEAFGLKFNRPETTLFRSSGQGEYRRKISIA
uniref:11S globulin seed storage protein n=1 Tax=Amaranthus hypochondriacus TaxID=28502 RepID=UPI000245948C|nr:Chain A, 11S globulin seed storage protein [Amaranthus hypochondriacus]